MTSSTGKGDGKKEGLNVVGLLSGGKDSCYNLCHCAALGHKIVALATLCPPKGKDELDSYMYQTVGHDAVHLIAEAMEVPLYRTTITGQAVNQTSTYGDRLPSGKTKESPQDETEDLHRLLLQVKRAHPEINAVSVGAILSNYQRVRVEHVALRLDIQLLPLSFLWQRDQAELLDEMCQASMESVLIKVAGAGLNDGDLGKSLAQMRAKLHRLNTLYGAHICGEGGEYETFTLDCPLFKHKIVLDETVVVMHGESSSDGVFYLKINAAHLAQKEHSDDALALVAIPPRLDKLSDSCLQHARRVTSPKKEVYESKSAFLDVISAKALSRQRSGSWFGIGSVCGERGNEVSDEIRSAFAALQDALHVEEMTLAHLAHLNVYLSGQEHFAALNSVYKGVFGVDPPSRACVAVALDGHAIMIDAVACREETGTFMRKALHVQGRSHWAAANIGPYSQAVDAAGCISIAGQIGLDPQTLQLVEQGDQQAVLALQHARRIFKAVLEDRRVDRRQGWIEGCICWFCDPDSLSFLHALWMRQADNGEEEDDDDEGEKRTWEANWLGTAVTPSMIPTVYALLASDGLPRQAAVEWQLSAYNGDVGRLLDEDEDGYAEFALPKASSGMDISRSWICEWRSMSSEHTSSSFGIACLRKSEGQSGTDDLLSSSTLSQHLSTAMHVRVLYMVDMSDVHEILSDRQDCAITYVPVKALFDPSMQPIAAAVIWQGRRT